MGNKGMGWVTGGTALAAALGLVACGGGSDNTPAGAGGTAGIVAGTGGTGGTAGVVGGTGGTAGVVGGTGGTAGVVGGTGGTAGVVGGTGGTGAGTGGTAGNPPMCATQNDIRTGSMCEDSASGWFAIKTQLDVWWQGVPTRDPGRGNIDIYLLGKLEDVCNDGSSGIGTMKACGTTLPPFTSDVACDAFQIEFPNEIWDSPTMPRFFTTGSTTGFNPGDILTIARTTGLVGIDLMDNAIDGTWPDAAMTGSFPCEGGTGVNCFPDHDNDMKPGITIRIRADEADYTYGNVDEGGVVQGANDTKYGKCTGGASGTTYKYRGAPTGLNLNAGGGAGGGVRAVRVQIGLRTRLGGAGAIANDCASGVGDSNADFLDSRAVDCQINRATLDPANLFEARNNNTSDACTPAESQFVNENVPIYRVLQNGETPGDAMPPLGWAQMGRDIDKRMSAGPKSALIRLGGLEMAEPSCATVRAANYPAL